MGVVACSEELGSGSDAAAGTTTGTTSRAPTAAGTRAGNQSLAGRLWARQSPLKRFVRLGLTNWARSRPRSVSATGSRVAPWGFVPSDGGMKVSCSFRLYRLDCHHLGPAN